MSKKELLYKLYAGQHLTTEEAELLMMLITEGKLGDVEISSVLMFYKLNPISIGELSGFRKVLLEKCIKFHTPFQTIDVCGTGGDEKDTFNISTLSAIVVAACGYKVAKHGNYGVSSVSGSSNILEYFGYRFTNHQELLIEQLSQNNICFLHAPLFHPALKHVAATRKQLGTKTVFNLLGPLVNPSNITHQFIGVNSMETMRHYHYLLQQTNINYALAHSVDGYDEISLTGLFKVMGKDFEKITHPLEIGLPVVLPKDLDSGRSLQHAAQIFSSVLENRSTEPQKQAVIVNAAFAIQLITQNKLTECVSQATEAIESEEALRLFKKITQTKHEYT